MFIKKFKKIIAIATALITICSCTGVFTCANAATSTIVYGDVNADGKVDIGDLVVFNKYLVGACSITNYDEADVNCNGIISALDRDVLAKYLTKSIDSLPV
jgi:hypothetical protein